MNHDPKPMAPEDLRPYFGAIALIANADHELSDEELIEFRQRLAHHEVPPDLARELATLLAAPPSLEEVTQALRSSPHRFTVYLDCYLMACVDGALTEEEQVLLGQLQERLRLSDDEAKALQDFADTAREMSDAEGRSQEAMAEALKEAAANVAAVGVPVGAIAASGSVAGLSAAGITSGLAALGMGFGMISGVGTCIALGFASYKAVRWMLSDKDKQDGPTRRRKK